MKWVVPVFVVVITVLTFGGVLEDYVKTPYDVKWFIVQEETLEDGSLYCVLSVETQKWKGITWVNRVGITTVSYTHLTLPTN